MSAWGNTDSSFDKPKFSKERQVRSEGQLITANTTSAGATVITFSDQPGFQPSASPAINEIVNVGDYVAGVNIAGGLVPGFFASNTTVLQISNNDIVLSTATIGPIPSGTSIDFDYAIQYDANTFDATYNADTVLVNRTRLANTVGFANTETPHTGWVLTQTGTGGRAGRVTTEVLAVISEPVVTDPNSGRTSNANTYYSGV